MMAISMESVLVRGRNQGIEEFKQKLKDHIKGMEWEAKKCQERSRKQHNQSNKFGADLFKEEARVLYREAAALEKLLEDLAALEELGDEN